MSTKAVVLKLLHLGEIWKCKKKTKGGLCPFLVVSRERACAESVSRQEFLCRDMVLRSGVQR